MITFKEFLILEGGNVQIGDISAERIDLKKFNRDWIVERLFRTLKVINLSFQKEFGLPLWNTNLFKSKKFLSGSAFHFFNREIATAEFIKYKNTVGDIDTQVDKALESQIQKFLDSSIDKKYGYASLIGYKKSVGQFITLWGFDNPKINIQIDLELVDFIDGFPTEWSQFSHSSAWEDMRLGIKGVFQKYLLRAFTTKSLREIIILKGKKETPTKILSTDLAFSVTQGLRVKINPVLNPDGSHMKIDDLLVYKEIPTRESTYTNDLKNIFKILFNTTPTPKDLENFQSFIGGLQLANQYLTIPEKQNLIKGFTYTLFGPGAQSLYRDNPELDNTEKMVALNKMIDVLGVTIDRENINKMRIDYYRNLK